jgi:transcriptional regulator
MHPNPAFRQLPARRHLDFARRRGFGILAVNAPDGPLVSHLPFLVSDDGATLDLHLVRSNPILQLLPAPAVIAVSGPDAYVSPDWYDIDDQVPTWNYVAVHLRGTLALLPDDAMATMLSRQSAAMEAALLPKQPWTMAKMTPGVAERMMRAIRPCRMAVQHIEGTWKLNQNKPDAARLAAADRMTANPLGSEVAAMATLMRNPPTA